MSVNLPDRASACAPRLRLLQPESMLQPSTLGMQVPTLTDLGEHFDLTISHPTPDMPSFTAFDRWLAQAANARGLSCALIHEGIAKEAIRRLEMGRLTVGFHLDYYSLWHVPDDPYARLSLAVQDAGGWAVNTPARARLFTDKASAHAELVRRGLGVPETVIRRADQPDRPLSGEEWARLRLNDPGARLFIKPANGFGGKGIQVASGRPEETVAAIAAARNHDRRDSYLLQREVSCPRLRGEDGIDRPAYWRVFYCLGTLLPCWWSKQSAESGKFNYHPLSPAEVRGLRLQPILDYTAELADLSGMDWFSTELCLSEGPEFSRYRAPGPEGRSRPVIAIDYINDQCDVDVQSRVPGAPPDQLVRQIAEIFAEAAWQRRQILSLPRAFRLHRRSAA